MGAKKRTVQPNIPIALELYYSNLELSNNDISRIFGGISTSTVAKLKEKARAEMAKDKVMVFDSKCVNTEYAFRAWGLDVAALEKRYKKLQQLFPNKNLREETKNE